MLSPGVGRWLSAFEVLVTLLFWFDFASKFTLTFRNHLGELVFEPKLIAERAQPAGVERDCEQRGVP